MDDPVTFRLTLALLFIVFVAHRGYYHRKLAPSVDAILEEKEAGAASSVANLIALPALIAVVVYIVNPTWMSWSSLPLSSPVRWLGVGMALIGFVLLQWSHQALGQNWSAEPRLIKGQKLVSGGPYRWIRHPIYAAFLLILSAPLLIASNWFIGCLWIGTTALDVTSRIMTEEALMLSQFGDEYRVYMQRTGRLLPRIVRSREHGS